MAHHHGAVAFAFAFPCLLVGVSVDLVWLVKVSSVWSSCLLRLVVVTCLQGAPLEAGAVGSVAVCMVVAEDSRADEAGVLMGCAAGACCLVSGAGARGVAGG